MKEITKDPDAKLNYGFDWTDWLDDGETITSATWTVPADLTLEQDSIAGGVTIAWLSGGDPATRYYRLTCQITTSAGKIDDRSFTLEITER